jgi:hypothetical protein
LYGYVVNDPVNWVDPNGFKSIKVSGYWGMGGSVTIGSDHGQAFVKVGVGVGVGDAVGVTVGVGEGEGVREGPNIENE